MKSIIVLLFVAIISLLSSCRVVESKTDFSNNSAVRDEEANQREEVYLVAVKKNVKHNVSVLFYRYKNPRLASTENSDKRYNQIVIREDGTNKQSNPIKTIEEFQDVWSPNEEYLLLNGGVCKQDGFCIYKTADIVEAFKQSATFEMPPATDFITLTFVEYNRKLQKGEVARCAYNFTNWDGEASLVFKGQPYDIKEWGEFKYNLLNQIISSTDSVFVITPSSEYGFKAINKNGKLEFVRE